MYPRIYLLNNTHSRLSILLLATLVSIVQLERITDSACLLWYSWVKEIFFLPLSPPLLSGHFIRLTVLWTKKCVVSGLIMGFIGLKNRNLPLPTYPPLCRGTQTHTHTQGTGGQTGWPAEWVCAVVMIRLLNGAVLCHGSCWGSGLTEGIWSILPLSLFLSSLFLLQAIFYHSWCNPFSIHELGKKRSYPIIN